MELFIRPTGATQCLYGEEIELQNLGALNIKRASHVEPDPETPGKWTVDLSPVGGPFISGFPSRAEALRSEAQWLNNKMALVHVEAT